MTEATEPIVKIADFQKIGPVTRRHFGAFVEHGGRSVYTGIYEPLHPTADEHGFRGDVADLIRELGISTVRYPGGNFVSGYRWEDGIGPREQRPVRRELAWHALETNQVGTDDFIAWCARNDLEPMLAINLATRGVAEAIELQDYVNGNPGSTLADLRGEHGYPEPHGVRMWCLGNEMDGPWQIGAMNADDYGKIAARTAAAMRMADPRLELVVCGSSFTGMATFGEWERTVLRHSYDYVDYISCHSYYQLKNEDFGSFLASSLDMQHFIDTTSAIIDEVRDERGSDKTVAISFDEWNVWYQNDAPFGPDEWPVAPRQMENRYSVADAVVVGNLMITLLQNVDRVHSASLAQLVNAIAPIVTEPEGPAWRQTSFYPFAITSRLASGEVFRPTSAVPEYDTDLYGSAKLIDAVLTVDRDAATGAVFLVNRSLADELAVEIDISAFPGASRVVESVSLWDQDLMAANSIEHPERVRPKANDTARIDGGILTITLPPVSWTAIGLGA